MEQRAGKDGIGQRVGRTFEARAVAVDRGDRLPERIAGRGELRRDLPQQAGGPQLAKRVLAVAGSRIL